MLYLLKIVCLFCLSAIIAQDFKERKVYTWLLFMVGLCMPLFYYLETNTLDYFINIGINLGILLLIVGILFFYSKLRFKQHLGAVLGLGDLLFFITIAISFPMATFLVLFSCSLFFSLVVFLFLTPVFKDKNVPLAGLQSLFFLLIFSSNWSFEFTNLYAF